jgi:hypothetical protein
MTISSSLVYQRPIATESPATSSAIQRRGLGLDGVDILLGDGHDEAAWIPRNESHSTGRLDRLRPCVCTRLRGLQGPNFDSSGPARSSEERPSSQEGSRPRIARRRTTTSSSRWTGRVRPARLAPIPLTPACRPDPAASAPTPRRARLISARAQGIGLGHPHMDQGPRGPMGWADRVGQVSARRPRHGRPTEHREAQDTDGEHSAGDHDRTPSAEA